jgi:hypothetical protein
LQSGISRKAREAEGKFHQTPNIPPEGEVRSGSHSIVVINDKRNQLRDIADEYEAGGRYARIASIVS